MLRPRFFLLPASLLLALYLLTRITNYQLLFSLTGEENTFSQIRALLDLGTDLIRPPLDLQPEVPIQYNGVNPFGINTFLQHEVEPAKRARQVQLIAAAGFHWVRQEFPWYDIEIEGKGNFEDCRFPPCHSAWDKYDEIVNLAEQSQLELIVRLSSPPAWSRADGTARGDYAPPDNFTDYADYTAAVAERYKGRVRFYQVWNEPNIYYEWGNQPADPEAYTRLLCETYARLKAVDPNIVVLSGVLAPTSELGALNDVGGNNLNDFIFLQRMYNAGAQPCFDILSVQGYGLWSGPTDHRQRPININYARNQLIRDLMVKNGDAHKAIWISEMNWNAVPAGSGLAPNYGQVTEAQQAHYVPLAYQRAQDDWPWVGVNTYWFFKRADDSEKNQAWYYFRMAEPDFTLLPVYHAMHAYTRQPPLMHPGWFQEDHWAVTWDGNWQLAEDPRYTFNHAMLGEDDSARARFAFTGTDLSLSVMRGPDAGTLTARMDSVPLNLDLHSDVPHLAIIPLAHGLTDGQHTVELTNTSGHNVIDGFIVKKVADRTWALLMTLMLVLGVWYGTKKFSS